MIQILTVDQIIELPLSTKEKYSTSRSRLGYHVFISWYFGEFKALSEESRREIVAEFVEDDVQSLDSIATPPNNRMHVSLSMKAAARFWANSTEDHRNAWRLRANQLNQMILPGSFKKIPPPIFVDGIDENVRHSLQSDWLFVMKKLRSMIVKKPQAHLASMTYKFGKERVQIKSQSFASFQLNYLINLCIFGKDYNLLSKSELVYQSTRVTIIHISSIERVKKLLTIDGVSGATFEENNLLFSASPKAYVLCDGQEIEGYVLRRRNSNLIIRTSNNDIVECRAPKWVENLQKYQYFIEEGCAYVKEFAPIRFLVSAHGEVKITLYRYTVDIQSGNIVVNSSS